MSKIYFYKYYFENIQKPIIIETHDRLTADDMLIQLQEKTGVKLDMSKLIDCRIEVPLIGVSSKIKNGVKLIWVGRDRSLDGWMESHLLNTPENKF